MPSKIQVDQIAGATGNTVTLPSGQTLDLSSGTVNLPSASLSALNASNLTSGTVPNARLSGITADKLDLISTASVPSITAKGTPSVSDGYIQLNCEQNSHGIKIKSPPHSAGATYTMVMPSAIGTSNQVLKMNSGATALEFATPVAGGITEADVWRINTTFSSASGIFNTNWERADTDNFTQLGTGMTEASGVFSFPSTGWWRIDFKTYGYASNAAYHIVFLYLTLNNSTFDDVCLAVDSANTGGNSYVGGNLFHVVKITDIANQKVRFEHSSASSVTYEASTSNSQTQAQFIKLAGL